jgi:spermidine synthase
MFDPKRLLLQSRPFVKADGDMVSLHFETDAIQSLMSCKDPFALQLPYTKTMMGFLLTNPNPRHILMIGLGGGSMVKFCHEHLPCWRQPKTDHLNA